MENTNGTPQAQGPKFTNTQWDALLEQAVSTIKGLAKVKGSEYSGEEDRLRNFREGAARYHLPMEVIWGVYAGKHYDAINTYIKDLNTGVLRQRSEPIDGRVDDLLVYLLLFKAMLEERSGPKDVIVKVHPLTGIFDAFEKPVFCYRCGYKFSANEIHNC